MNLKALRRPHGKGPATTELTYARRSRREPVAVRPESGGARPTARWTAAADGRVVLVCSLPERPARTLIDRKRGSDA